MAMSNKPAMVPIRLTAHIKELSQWTSRGSMANWPSEKLEALGIAKKIQLEGVWRVGQIMILLITAHEKVLLWSE